MRKLRGTCVAAAAILVAVLGTRASTQITAANTTWQGWIQCQVTVQGIGYSNRQTHTWTITGAPTVVGAIPEYPVTWTVTGDGTLRGTLDQAIAAQWTTNGSVPSVKIGIFIRASDNRLVALVRSAQLSVPTGTTGTQVVAGGLTRPIAQAVYEWRPLPVMEDAATSTHLVGSNSMVIVNRLDALQPAAATGQTVCSWDFARPPSVPGPLPSVRQSDALIGAAIGKAPATVIPSGGASTAGGAAVSGISSTTSGAAAGGAAGAGGTPPPTPAAAGCDAEVPIVACQLGTLHAGMSVTDAENFHVASNTSDWMTATGIVSPSEAPFAVMNLSITGGAADGIYAIKVSEGPLPPTVLVSSGASHAPTAVVSWATASASSKTLRIEVQHVAGAPSNDLYTLHLALSMATSLPK